MTSPSPTESDVESMFTQYRRSQIAELRPYVPGESMADISISKPDVEAGSPKLGDMIARNPKNYSDRWLVAAKYFADNFEPAVPSQSPASADTPVSVGDGLQGAFLETCREPYEDQATELFEGWWERDGKYIDPDTDDVPWFDKRKELAANAYRASMAQSGNYVADKSVFPTEFHFSNGRIVMLAASPHPVKPMTQEHHGLDNEGQVFFYEQDFYVLSNFSAFEVQWSGFTFKTSEHLYHWLRFTLSTVEGRIIATEIANARSAHDAFKISQENKQHQVGHWDALKVDLMREILREKVKQHEYVRRKLLATGERELIENSWRDDFWGWGPNRDGQNMLGKLWMEVRAELRKGATP